MDEITIKMPREVFEGLRAAIKGLDQMLNEAGAQVSQEQALPPELDPNSLAGFEDELNAGSLGGM